jgi:hypothetical protein
MNHGKREEVRKVPKIFEWPQLTNVIKTKSHIDLILAKMSTMITNKTNNARFVV